MRVAVFEYPPDSDSATHAPAPVPDPVPDADADLAAPKKKRGRGPIDVAALMQGRIPAFDSASRAKYLTDHVSRYNAANTPRVMHPNPGLVSCRPFTVETLMRAVWGTEAPVEFQSILVHAKTLYTADAVADAAADPIGAIPLSWADFMYHVMPLVYAAIVRLTSEVQPRRHHDVETLKLSMELATLRDTLVQTTHGLSVLDVWARNEKYRSTRRRAPDIIQLAHDTFEAVKLVVMEVKVKTGASSARGRPTPTATAATGAETAIAT